MQPGAFWDMTLHQLLTLADQHRAAHRGSDDRPTPSDGSSLVGLAMMRRA
ncbi:hypothetical protein AB0B79_25915 [Streptomyces sp. NPDC039022]